MYRATTSETIRIPEYCRVLREAVTWSVYSFFITIGCNFLHSIQNKWVTFDENWEMVKLLQFLYHQKCLHSFRKLPGCLLICRIHSFLKLFQYIYYNFEMSENIYKYIWLFLYIFNRAFDSMCLCCLCYFCIFIILLFLLHLLKL